MTSPFESLLQRALRVLEEQNDTITGIEVESYFRDRSARIYPYISMIRSFEPGFCLMRHRAHHFHDPDRPRPGSFCKIVVAGHPFIFLTDHPQRLLGIDVYVGNAIKYDWQTELGLSDRKRSHHLFRRYYAPMTLEGTVWVPHPVLFLYDTGGAIDDQDAVPRTLETATILEQFESALEDALSPILALESIKAA